MAAAETAGPSTTLRSGRDDNSVAGSDTVPLHLVRLLQNCHPDRSVPGFPTSRCQRRPRVRLSAERAVCSSSAPPLSTGNPGERSGETCCFSAAHSQLQLESPLSPCHPDRSEAQWSDLQCALRLSQIFPRKRSGATNLHQTPTPNQISQCRVATLVCPTISTPQMNPGYFQPSLRDLRRVLPQPARRQTYRRVAEYAGCAHRSR
jgi:hypothetical protein